MWAAPRPTLWWASSGALLTLALAGFLIAGPALVAARTDGALSLASLVAPSPMSPWVP
jgi:hypothetical protein